MEFSGQYLTYAEYLCLGGTLHPTPFKLIEFEARRQIDGKTMNRFVNSENIPNEVKMCMFNLINSIDNYSGATDKITNNSNVASENIDGYSVSYITPAQIKEMVEANKTEIDTIITNYLLGVMINGEHALYCGV